MEKLEYVESNFESTDTVIQATIKDYLKVLAEHPNTNSNMLDRVAVVAYRNKIIASSVALRIVSNPNVSQELLRSTYAKFKSMVSKNFDTIKLNIISNPVTDPSFVAELLTFHKELINTYLEIANDNADFKFPDEVLLKVIELFPNLNENEMLSYSAIDKLSTGSAKVQDKLLGIVASMENDQGSRDLCLITILNSKTATDKTKEKLLDSLLDLSNVTITSKYLSTSVLKMALEKLYISYAGTTKSLKNASVASSALSFKAIDDLSKALVLSSPTARVSKKEATENGYKLNLLLKSVLSIKQVDLLLASEHGNVNAVTHSQNITFDQFKKVLINKDLAVREYIFDMKKTPLDIIKLAMDAEQPEDIRVKAMEDSQFYCMELLELGLNDPAIRVQEAAMQKLVTTEDVPVKTQIDIVKKYSSDIKIYLVANYSKIDLLVLAILTKDDDIKVRQAANIRESIMFRS